MSLATWKERLGDAIPEPLGSEIDVFETQIELRRQGKIDEKIFAETRLRRGTYGQRYDNGRRHDGLRTRTLAFPSGELTKGPETLFDAPGMQRIKIPMGRLSPEQAEALADLAEEYSDGILHVTTRQDFQLHFVHIDDTPALMRRLAAVGITTREACGNSVRNVTACPIAGVCGDEAFDVTPYAEALAHYLLGHKDTQSFGRKFKVSFSGCKQHACGLASFHDIGCIATTANVDGERKHGFQFFVGGGLGAVPRQAQLLEPFVSEEELLPLSQAVCRVFARLGEKKNRTRARLKFLVNAMGLDEFRRVVHKERAGIPADERWTAYLDAPATGGAPVRGPSALDATDLGPAFAAWRRTNVQPQRQAGYVAATARLPLGDLTSPQMRVVADLARHYGEDSLRTTVEQNLLLRWVPEGELGSLFQALEAVGLGQPGASTMADITACPGTDTCKLGISSSRGLAAELEHRLGAKADALDDAVKGLRIKTSGCFNACGQHHVADIGFLGVSRNIAGRRVAHFQLVVGGEWHNNGGSYGLAIGAFPSKRIPELVDRLTGTWAQERQQDERFQDFIRRVGRGHIKEVLDDLREVPAYEVDPGFFTDWADSREYTIGDLGMGECAGEVVTFSEFGLATSERQVFEAQLHLDKGEGGPAAELAYRAMLSAAQALVRVVNVDVTDDADQIVAEFRTHFHDTKLFHDPYAGAKFSSYLLTLHASPPSGSSLDHAHQTIEEAQLFIEAAHACYDRLQEQSTPLG